MGNVLTNDVVTNASDNDTDISEGSAVVHVNSNGVISTKGGKTGTTDFSAIENKLTNKFDELDYYEIPGAIDGGSFTPTPTPSPTLTPTPTPTPTSTPTS